MQKFSNKKPSFNKKLCTQAKYMENILSGGEIMSDLLLCRFSLLCNVV